MSGAAAIDRKFRDLETKKKKTQDQIFADKAEIGQIDAEIAVLEQKLAKLKQKAEHSAAVHKATLDAQKNAEQQLKELCVSARETKLKFIHAETSALKSFTEATRSPRAVPLSPRLEAKSKSMTSITQSSDSPRSPAVPGSPIAGFTGSSSSSSSLIAKTPRLGTPRK